MAQNPIVTVVSNPSAGQRRGDWEVRSNGNRVSTHRKKSTAKKKARKHARARDGQVRVQNQDGTFRTVASY